MTRRRALSGTKIREHRPGMVLAIVTLLAVGNARAQTIEVRVDSSFAEYLLGVVCSDGEVDEGLLRKLPVLQSQIKHHSNHTPERNLDAFVDGLEAAAKCETIDDDLFRFAPVVEDREAFAAAVAYFKGRADEISDFVATSLSPYVPTGLEYRGDLVLSIVGNGCGGFSMDGRFFLALSCLRNSYEAEFETARLIAAHETYHDLQYEFFHPFDEDIGRVRTLDDAFDYHFMNLLLEGTAEFVADSRQLVGGGAFTDFLTNMTDDAYGNMPFNFRLFSYTAELLQKEELLQRLKDVYRLGYSGSGGQAFYFVGAEMARDIERVFGRHALVCVIGLPPEQFVRAYHAGSLTVPYDEAPRLGKTMIAAADRLSNRRDAQLRFERCTSD